MAGAYQLLAVLTYCLLATATPVSQSSISYAIGYATNNTTIDGLDLPAIYGHNTAANPNDAAIHCYIDDAVCYGISRAVAAEALVWYCNHYDRYLFVDSNTAAYGDWLYKPQDLPEGSPDGQVFEEGQVHMEMVTISTCDPNVYMNPRVCYANMMAAIDSCDTATENDKHGGTASSGCIQYRFNPNPSFWPKCKTSED